MDIDDLEPRKPIHKPKALDEMSIEALHAYIVELEAEIERVKADIDAKQDHRSSAEAFFKS